MDRPSLGTVLERILDQIGNELGQQLAIPVHDGVAAVPRAQRQASFASHRLKQLHQLVSKLPHIDIDGGSQRRPRLRQRNLQQNRQRALQPVDFSQSRLYRFMHRRLERRCAQQ